MAALCFNSSTAFVDVLPPPCAMPMESLIAPESILGGFVPSSVAETPILSSSLQMANTMATTASNLSNGESEVLDNAMHAALDFTGIFRPSKSTQRLLSIGGRLLGLVADYIPDHNVHPEQVLIQLALICMTGQELLEEGELDFSF